MWSTCRLPLQCSPSPSPAIRLNSLQYSELRDKLQAPIRTARNIVIQQSLSDRFAAAFLDQVRRNGIYSLPPGSPVGSSHFLFLHTKESGYKATMAEYQCHVCLLLQPLENCVGCLQKMPQVKLQKRCAEPEVSCLSCNHSPHLSSPPFVFYFPSSLLLSFAPSFFPPHTFSVSPSLTPS